jgi:hypothetical protein
MFGKALLNPSYAAFCGGSPAECLLGAGTGIRLALTGNPSQMTSASDNLAASLKMCKYPY